MLKTEFLMKNKKPFSISDRFKSFTYAFEGIKTLFQYEHNSRVHLLATISVIILAILLKVNILEWIALLIVIGMVFCAEIFNSAIETLCDKISPQKDEWIKRAKDLGAAGVLVVSFVALLVGGLIFVPKILMF
ncbi:MAG: diacylglycerol kinase family protein [Flammeovirgaceae bacterium]